MSRQWSYSLAAVIVCGAATIPSFIWSSGCHVVARASAVMLFVIAYGAVVHTPLFWRVWSNRRWRRAVQVGYGARVFVSVAFPLGLIADLFPGMISASITGLDARSFASASFGIVFLTTVIQGMLLHVPLAVLIVMVHWFLTAIRFAAEEPTGRAFEVIPIAQVRPAPSSSPAEAG